MKIVGIDLAGSPKRKTGFCVLDERMQTKTSVLATDKEIICETKKENPDIISIDAPLSLPAGRCCLRKTCSCRKFGHLRKCDRELLNRRIRFFPITLGPMRKLTMRGIKLKKIFEKKNFRVIESFPGSIQDILGMPRKQNGLGKLRRALIKFGFKGDVGKKDLTDDELDAITSALVGKLFLENNYTAIGSGEEIIIVPRILPQSKHFIAENKI